MMKNLVSAQAETIWFGTALSNVTKEIPPARLSCEMSRAKVCTQKWPVGGCVDVDSIMILLSSVLPPSPSGINHLLCGGCNYAGQHLTAWLNLFFPPTLPVLVLACHTSLLLLFTTAISGTLSAVSFGIEAAKQSEADCRS